MTNRSLQPELFSSDEELSTCEKSTQWEFESKFSHRSELPRLSEARERLRKVEAELGVLRRDNEFVIRNSTELREANAKIEELEQMEAALDPAEREKRKKVREELKKKLKEETDELDGLL